MSATLCIDIGQTLIKAAVLKDDDVRSVKDLREVRTHVIPTLGWLNESFSRLVDESYWPSLTHNHSFAEYDRLAVTIPAKVIGGRLSPQSPLLQWGMPEDPAQALRESLRRDDLEIRIVNDAHAWLEGAIAYFRMAGKKITFPCALIALGTGIAFAYAETKEQFRLVEFVEEPLDWTPLRKVAGVTAEVYEILGEPFFESVRHEHKDWDFERICEEFSGRFTAFLNTVLPRFPFKTLFIGGGHADYLHRADIRTDTPVDQVFALRGRKRDIDIDADLIPLLGLLRLAGSH